MLITTVTSKGQATIPSSIRKKLGLKPGERVIFEEEGDKVVVRKIPHLLDLMGSIKTTKKYNQKAINKAIGKMLAARHQRINEEANRR